jgi:hypothetical protein
MLDRLLGSWDLRGQMGATALHQHVVGRRVLDGRYVELRFRELDGDPYEAVYYVGLEETAGVYVLHLLDSTGVYTEPAATVATGRREGEAIAFRFGDELVNRFEWHAAEEAWTFELTRVEDGAARTFATKRMVRSS